MCSYMGHLIPPPNVSTSAEKITCIRYHPSGKFLGILQSGAKSIDVYAIRGLRESARKRQRRLRRRQEKEAKKAKEPPKAGEKRGILDDPESSDDEADSVGETAADNPLDPAQIAASDEFEYATTSRASHKIRGFSFSPTKEKGELVRIVCALSTNSLEILALTRKTEE